MPTRPTTFSPRGRSTGQAARRTHDRDRGSARQRGYDSRWDRQSREHRRRHPLCVGCDAVGRFGAAKVTDHIVPHRGDQALLRDPANLQSACAWHHDVVKQRLEAAWQAGRVGVAALRLDSAEARALTLRLDPRD